MTNASSDEPYRHSWLVIGLIVALIVSITLFKYALDIFLIVVLLGCAAFVLHVGTRLVADSELLSPAWIVIILMIVATAIWLFVPGDVLSRAVQIERHLPRPIAAFLEWSEERGWAQRALVPAWSGEGTGNVSAGAPIGSARQPASEPPSAPRPTASPFTAGISVTVAAQQTTVRAGQPVTIAATVSFPAPPAPNASRSVRFRDGRIAIGTAPLELSGNVATATLTTGALFTGSHSITASYAGPGLFGTVTSQPVTVTVTGPQTR